MSRGILVLGLLALLFTKTWAQCVVSKDNHGQVVTTCEVYSEGFGRSMVAAHKQISYLGSEYLTFPVWQQGKIRLDESGKEVPCLLAYSLVDNKVMCRFDNEMTAATSLSPYSFTIDGLEFVRQVNKTLGLDYKFYAIALYNGQTKLLKSFSSALTYKPVQNSYEKNSSFEGSYQRQEKFYIRKGDAPPQLTNLTKSSLLEILYDQSEKIASRLPDKRLTSDDVVKTLTYYDSLTTASNVNKPSLNRDPLFNDFLHGQIKYPSMAWNSGVYGRVYIGFEVTERGQLINIASLSPDNGGFGFDQEVKQALNKLSTVMPTHAGKYALPVSFTYTNIQDKKNAYVPVITIPTERLEERIVLNEVVVPIVIAKPVVTSREVWGYYK